MRALKIGVILGTLLLGPPQPVLADGVPPSVQLEIAFWEAIAGSTIAQDFRAYLREYPNGTFRDLAVNRLTKLDPAPSSPPTGDSVPLVPAAMDQSTLQTLDMVFWSSIKQSRDRNDFDAYLRKFPEGTFRELAESRRAVLNP